MQGWWIASYVVLWLLVLVLASVVVALARQIGTLHLRLGPRGALEMDDEGPPIGEAPPPDDLVDTTGAPVRIGGPGDPQLLLFVSPGCGVCQQVLPSVAVVAAAGQLKPFVLTDMDEEETRLAYAAKKIGAPVLSARFLVQRWDIPGTPYVIVLDEFGVIRAKGTVNNLEQMEGLVDSAARRLAEAKERHLEDA